MTETQLRPRVPRATSSSPAGTSVAPKLTGDEIVDDLIEQHPGVQAALMAYGLCTCCSGGLSLRQNAEAHGVPLSVILADLDHELAKGA